MSEPETSQESEAPATGGASFWTAGPGVAALDDPTPFGEENALKSLTESPFKKNGVRGGFRLMGYLNTVYSRVSQDLSARENADADAPTPLD